MCRRCATTGSVKARDGFALLMDRYGWDFARAAQEVERIIGAPEPLQRRTAASPLHSRRAPHDASSRLLTAVSGWLKPIAEVEAVCGYFRHRGLSLPEASPLAALPPGSEVRVTGSFAALVAPVLSADELLVTYHLTLVAKDGRPANVKPRKRVLPVGVPGGMRGAAIRLAPLGRGSVLGLAEGVETALSASVLFGVPVWACVSAGGLEAFALPTSVRDQVRCVLVFGDRDPNGAGEKAATRLMERLERQYPIHCEVWLPPTAGSDWNDVLRAKTGR